MAAAVKGRRDAAAFLIDAGADIEALAEKDGITEKFDDTSLLSQISDARYAGVDHSAIRDFDFTLKAKKTDDSLSGTAFLLAVANDQKEVVELFIDERGLDKAPWPVGALTPLRYAAYIGSANVIEPLVRAAADPNGETWLLTNALWAAVNGLFAEAAKVLLELGADVNAKSKDGKTALDLVWANGSEEAVEMIEILTKAGAK